MNELQRHPLNAKVATSRTVQLATEMIASGEVNGLHYLLRKSSPADVIPPGSLSITALNGHKRMTTFLIDQGVSVDEAGELGLPLRCASINGHNNICNILLSRGANIDENGPFGSALHAASMRGHLHTAKLLLDMGADANIRGGYYGTPLQAAAYHGHTELVQLLLAAKADVHAAGFSKDALHAAAEGGRHGVVQLFLDAGFQPAVQIIFGGQVASHQMRPRPNILRDSSPARRRSKAAPDPVAAVDPLDPAEGVPAYLAVGKKHSEWDDMLEAASALGHRDVVAFLLADGRCAFKEDALQFALATACRHGRFDAVEEITSGKHQLDLDLHEALHEATAGGHNGIVRTLLDSLVERGTSATLTSFETILIASMPDNPDIFAETLQRMKQVLSQSDAQGVLSECLPEAAKADCAETVSAIIAELPMITPDSLMNTFKRACDVGSSAAASVIFDQTPVTTPQLVRRIRAAAADEYEDLLQFLLDKCVGADLETYIDGIIYLAAGDGSLGVMALLLTWSSKWQLTTTATLDTALALGAQNGHEEVCELLMSQGASPVHSVQLYDRSDLVFKRRRVRTPRKIPKTRVSSDRSSNRSTSASGSESDDDSDDDPVSASSLVPLESENIEHDAVQSCLAGYGRFQRDHDRSRHWFELNHTPTWHVQDEAAQTRTLRTVLDGVVSFDERHWSHKVCTAAQLCPPAALEILLLKNVSARPVAMPENVLQVAASRKRWSHSTMQLLLQAGSDQDLEDSDLRELLMASLAQFDDSDGSLFPGVRSLDELFVSGCGAAIAYLLSQLPHEDASGSGYAVLLQTAAAAGRLELVQLLIARNIDVNAIESQYGTALQAACRFSHTGVAEVLLKAGADPNLVGGKHCTALRAAVLSGSLPTVLLLLRFQADTELTGSRGSTALHLAVQEEHAPIVTALIAAGTSVKDVDDDEWVPTLLISACGWGECFVVRRLIEAGADLQATRIESRHTSAMHAAISGAHHDVVQLLISCGFDLTTAHPDADDLLTLAVCEEDTAIVTTLLHHLPRGCDTMLLQASKAAMEHNLVDTLVQLLDAAWDVKSVSMLVELIRTACHTPHASIAELLFDHFSTLNDESDLGTALATIDIRKVRGELFEVWLRYAPYTIELFVEVCIRGELDLVQQGIDIGHRPHINDKWSRSPLHLAAAQGRPSVIQRILETGTDVNRVHARYGTALVTALEGLSADKLKDKSIEELDISYATELAELENLRCNFRYADSSDMDVWSMEYSNTSKRLVPFNKPREFRASKVEYAETIILFLSNGARADSPPGRFGTPLALAAFAKHDGICGLLISHGAKADVAGGILGSPLSVAIDRGHENIVDMLLGALKRTEYRPGPGDTVFYRACRIGSPSIVRQLLDLGHEPSMTNSEGATALEISLEEAHWEAPCDPDRARIVHMLMDADTRPIFCADELVAVTTIRDSCFQTTLMDRILASTEQHKIPEESFIRLLRTRHSQVLQQILDKKAVTSVTTAMLASAYDIDQLTLLLEYDSSYVVTPVTIDAIQTGRGEHTRDLVQALLLRDPSLCPTESQMFRALVAEDSSVLPLSKRDQPRVGSLLDLMFSRNPDLSVTHEMLETVRDPGGLKVLLAHVEPGKHVLTDSILMALKPRRKFDEDGVSARSSLTHPRSEESSTSTASFDWFGMSEAPTDSSGSLLRSEEDDAATSLSERSRGSDEDGVSTHSSESPRGFEEDDAAASSSEQSCRSDEDGASTVPSVRSCRFDASSRRAPWETLLEIFLDFEPSVKVSSEVVQQLLEDCSLDTVELLLDHDSDIILSSERIVSMLKSGRRRGFRRRRIAQILDSHPGQFAMTPEVEVFVDSCF